MSVVGFEWADQAALSQFVLDLTANEENRAQFNRVFKKKKKFLCPLACENVVKHCEMNEMKLILIHLHMIGGGVLDWVSNFGERASQIHEGRRI